MATLNSESVIKDCLESIRSQDYPKNKIEIIAADGGSIDHTLKILKEHDAKIYDNPLKTGEAGKAVSVNHAKNELILLLDSDNILPDELWLKRMVKPFKDNDIQMSEPIRYTWRKSGGFIERYSALVGMNDPFSLFIGNYDRWNYLTLKWTEIPHTEEVFENYLKIKLTNKLQVPTVGANGAIFRKTFFDNIDYGDYIFDIDLVPTQIKKTGSIFIAKVDQGIIHTFCEKSIQKFVRKQKRRVNDYLLYRKNNLRTFSWYGKKIPFKYYLGYVKFFLYNLLFIPLVIQSIKGYLRKRDIAWFFHPLACEITLFVYIYSTIKFIITKKSLSRDNWSQ